MSFDDKAPSYLSNSDIAKSVATTAQVIVNSTSSRNINAALMSNDTYQQSFKKTMNTEKAKELIKEHKENPHKFLFLTRKNKHDKDRKKKKKDFAVLSQEMLDDIPSPEPQSPKDGQEGAEGSALEKTTTNFSLFQGFNAILPEVDENLELFKKDPSNTKLLTLDGENVKKNPLPGNLTAEKIKISQSPKHLKHYKAEINYKLDLIEIRKELSSNEIHEIDLKIEKLYNMRKKIFDRIANFELDESYLEDQLAEIESRLELVKDIEIESLTSSSDDSAVNISVPPSKRGSAPLVDEDDEDYENVPSAVLDENGTPVTSPNSIQTKFKNTMKNVQRRVSSRRHRPTLQQYYKPGDKINEFHAHDDAVTSLAFDAPFGTLVTASTDNTVRVWDMNRYKCVGLLEGHLSTVKCMQMHDGLLVTVF
ncbi:unnamed protein product [Ambrosiozyma monospora]|uniref:Unnamed protein product n=1 Tax=Ambrosiozyma monospora TaxID=43982 RepID=A0ACB5SY80_AMBMO|nr:unnamed protein product [Ambrosiozyma monospora]